jgi:hypothetical protein
MKTNRLPITFLHRGPLSCSHICFISGFPRAAQTSGQQVFARFQRFEVFLGYTEEDPETVVPGPSRVFASGAEQLVERDHNVVIDAKACFVDLRSGSLLRFRCGELNLCRGVCIANLTQEVLVAILMEHQLAGFAW